MPKNPLHLPQSEHPSHFSAVVMIWKVVALLVVVVLGWAYQAIQPPPPNTCGSPNGPPVTSPRVQLSDGSYLAYRETGVPKEKAKYKIIFVHGFGSSKDQKLSASPELVEELGIYFLQYDRAGYGESDPNPKRTVKSEAFDIQELADRLDLGPKFYIIGVSMGGYPTWSCIKHISHRLAGVALVVPAVSYWWPSLPANLSKETYGQLLVQDQRTLWIARNTPWLLYAWMKQKLLPSCSFVEGHPAILSRQDLEIVKSMPAVKNEALQQGEFESIHRDLMVMFGKWEFDPTELTNPFPNNEGSVHIWQGYEDKIVPVQIQRYISQKLQWIRYHECRECGHLFVLMNVWCDRILKALLLGEEASSSGAQVQ